MALDPIDYRSQPSRRRPSEGLDQLATLCLTEVLLPGKLASYQLPTPRDGGNCLMPLRCAYPPKSLRQTHVTSWLPYARLIASTVLPSFRFLVTWDRSSHKTGKTDQILNASERRNSHSLAKTR